MTNTKTKTDAQVNTLLTLWRKSARDLINYRYRFEDTRNGEKYKKIIDTIEHLMVRPYKNPHQELLRWKTLYKEMLPALRAAKRTSCYGGSKNIENASNLYHEKSVTKTISLKIEVEISQSIYDTQPNDRLDWASSFTAQVTSKLPGVATKVTQISKSYY